MTYICNATVPGPSMAQMCGASAFVVFMSILEELLSSNEKISGRCERVKPIETPDEEYDFVVIGGGGAGSVVAARLSENPDWKVLVLEAGSDEPTGAQVPQFVNFLLETPADWNYTTTNESYACLSINGSCAASSGKMLGGSSAHNQMVYIRGNPTDYNNWAAEGNEGWTWEEVEPFFLLSEDNGEIERVGRRHHATGGPLSVDRIPYRLAIGRSILAASDEVGYGVSDDLNGEQFIGFTEIQTTSKNGVRRSSARAFLWPARNRKNLHVSLNSLATRILIENEKAVGVEYFKDGELKTVRASREVVASAGAIRSPHLLLLSGIGPKEHLESNIVKVVKDLPGVGENFQTHSGYNLSLTVNEADSYDNDWAIATEYLVNQTGPLSGDGVAGIVGTLMTESASPDFPDIQLWFRGYDETCAPGKIGALRSAGRRTVIISAVDLHPKSRGRVSLASIDPLEYPVIWGNYMSDPSDVDRTVESINQALVLLDARALRAYDFNLANDPIEACSDCKFPSDDYWRCAIHQNTLVEHHFSGSCKMGPSSDPMAVVDPRLRVHGIKGLRVADASIMPQVTSGNIIAPVVMIGERAADFIKKDWATKSSKETASHNSFSKCYLISKNHFPESYPSEH